MQLRHSCEAVNAAAGALEFICNMNASWLGDPSLTPCFAGSRWDLNATWLLLHRLIPTRANAPGPAQHPHGHGCVAEQRVKLISADSGVNVGSGEAEPEWAVPVGRAGSARTHAGVSGRVSSRRDALAGNPAART